MSTSTLRTSKLIENVNLSIEDSPYLLDEYSPVFILGCPRSGTTFLSSCIASIPNIEEFVGVLAPPRMMHQIGNLEKKGMNAEGLTYLMRDIFWQSFWRRSHFFSHRVGATISKRRFSDLLKKPSLEGKAFCYKEPFMCFAAPAIVKAFPTAKFIHIIRDGRDNADSMERSYPTALSDEVLQSDMLVENKSSEVGVHYKFNGFNIPWWVDESDAKSFISLSQYERFVWMWREMVGLAKKAGALAGTKRYLEVRYEAIVSEPEASAKKILNFLGYPASRKLLQSLGNGNQKSVGIAKKRQSESKLKNASDIAGELLFELGYL